MSWCSSVENLALLDNDSNGDSVPASVPSVGFLLASHLGRTL